MDRIVVKALHDAFYKGMREASFASVMAQLDQEFLYLTTPRLS